MAYRTGVVGASGYAGAELLRLLAGHPDLTVVAATAGTQAGQPVADLYPSLRPAYPTLTLEALDPGRLDGLDLVFLALPHGESQTLVPDLTGRVAHLVDLGADFRLPAADYQRWYGEPHQAPDLLADFVFGLPELFRDRITPHTAIAAPGCYPTAAALALAPLLATGVGRTRGAGRRTPRRASPGAAAACRTRRCSPKPTRPSPRTGSSTTATPARSNTPSPRCTVRRSRCCSPRTWSP